MEKLLKAVKEFVASHKGELAQDPELAAILRLLMARLKAKKRQEEVKQGKPRVRWI